MEAGSANLPIFEFRDEIVQMVKNNLFCLITGETGSGKSTQLSQFIIDHLKKQDFGTFDDKTLKDRYNYSEQDLENAKQLKF